MYIKVLVTKNRLENEYEKNKEDISEGLNKRLLTAGSTGTDWQAQAPIISGYAPRRLWDDSKRPSKDPNTPPKANTFMEADCAVRISQAQISSLGLDG